MPSFLASGVPEYPVTGEDHTNVIFLILDAFAPTRLSPRLTPTLWRWAHADRARCTVGRSVMASCTYPNHATFATGSQPSAHGIHSNVSPGGVGSWETGPAVPTLFDLCAAAGRLAEAVLGDHHLVGVMGAMDAGRHWPQGGRIPEGMALDPLGYPADDGVLPHLLEAINRRPDLLVGYLGSVDTISHVHGPESEEALAAYRELDLRLAEIDRELDWSRSVLMVVSDHDQETAADLPGIDLRGHALRQGVEVKVSDEGSAAVLEGPDDPRWLEGCVGVLGKTRVGEGRWLLWAEAGRFFGASEGPLLRGIHGGVHTRDQLALVSGGHPSVAVITAHLGRPGAADWAPTIAASLGLGFKAPDDRSPGRR